MSKETWRKLHHEEMKAYRRKWYSENKTHAKAKVRERKEEIQAWIRSIKSTLSCSCGESDPRVLDFHHKDPTKKSISIGSAAQYGWSKDKILIEIEKCIPLCSNCHRKLESKF